MPTAPKKTSTTFKKAMHTAENPEKIHPLENSLTEQQQENSNAKKMENDRKTKRNL